ncbi:MAG: phytanoyl-CoA dioxygenase family protein [Rhodospirillaceae bacterium]|jgi:phytanoyl-CoA hydroxylase
MAASLSKSQIEQYHEKGYVALEGAVPKETMDEMRRLTDEIVENAKTVSKSDARYDLDDIHTQAAPKVRRLKRPYDHWPFFNDLVRSDLILDAVESLLGPDLRIWNGKINFKTPGRGYAVEWHQDWAFYPHTNDVGLAMGIYMDDATYENGAMIALPGSHQLDAYDHHSNGYFCGAMDPEKCNDLNFKDFETVGGPAGTLTLHHVRLVHASAPNHTDKERRFFIAGYFAADAWPLIDGVRQFDYDEFKGYMARGQHREPRLDGTVPIKMPLPTNERFGSIYVTQQKVANRYFESYEETRAQSAAE